MKHYLKRMIALLLMGLISAGAIGYGDALFELSFATRTPVKEAEPVTPPPAWSLPLPEGTSDTAPTCAAQLAALSFVYDQLTNGKQISTSRYYSGASTIAQAILRNDVPFSVRLATVSREVRVPIGNDAAYRSELEFETIEQPVYSLYMGYILYENGADRQLLDATGKKLLSNFTFAPAYARDAQGRPLFVADGVYYRYDAQTNRMCEAVYDVTVLPMATAQDYAMSENTPYVRFCEDGKWGYKLRETGEIVISAIYGYAYDFYKNQDPEEDRPSYAYLAVVFSAESGQMQIIDTMGTIVVETNRSITYGFSDGAETATFEAWEGCFFPERTDNSFVLGMDRVDAYGMVRVRRRVVRKSNRDVVPVDEDVLLCIRRNGDSYGYHATYFEIPKGYRLCAYTEGVLLLQDIARGTYGYYSHEGYWLTDPMFFEASPMREGLATVQTQTGAYGVISAEGAWVFAPTFSYVSAPSDGVLLTYHPTTSWRIICKMK